MQQGYAAYRYASIDTADQGKLILIAYDVAIKNCKLAIEKFDLVDKIEERTKHLFKAQDAVTELLGALRIDVGEIAQNLYKLYDYILRTLVDAGVKNNKGKVVEVVGYLESLRDAWGEAIITVKSETAPAMSAGNVAVQG
ncbi:MAG: flagellar export chaperone FliS [Chitinispirillaceae bacterium]|nr:flagellar export chaperone FliS [Chitinispirillaceae bacterium]